MPPLKLLRLFRYPILKQLQLEEALLRAGDGNWCILNEGTASAIVMGISGVQEQLVNPERFALRPVPLIRRFSGGGTVFVDEGTFFVSFICNALDVGVPCFPEKVLHWTAAFYTPVFEGIDFKLVENDYAIGNKKCGGNAQYFRKGRWLHHSSFLWDFQLEQMEYLLHPPKTPKYRAERRHGEFLCMLSEHFEEKDRFFSPLIHQLEKQFTLEHAVLDECLEICKVPHRQATQLL